MKKIKLNLQQLKDNEVLSRDQLKTMMGGGIASGTGSCIDCYCGDTGQTSCWYTLDPSTLCQRVYPNCSNLYLSPNIGCVNCTMN